MSLLLVHRRQYAWCAFGHGTANKRLLTAGLAIAPCTPLDPAMQPQVPRAAMAQAAPALPRGRGRGARGLAIRHARCQPEVGGAIDLNCRADVHVRFCF